MSVNNDKKMPLSHPSQAALKLCYENLILFNLPNNTVAKYLTLYVLIFWTSQNLVRTQTSREVASSKDYP